MHLKIVAIFVAILSLTGVAYLATTKANTTATQTQTTASLTPSPEPTSIPSTSSTPSPTIRPTRIPTPTPVSAIKTTSAPHSTPSPTSPTNTPQKSEGSIKITKLEPFDTDTITSTNTCLTIVYTKDSFLTGVQMQYKVDTNSWSGWYNLYCPNVLSYLKSGDHTLDVSVQAFNPNTGRYLTDEVHKSFKLVDTQAPQITTDWSNPVTVTHPGWCFPTVYTDNFSTGDLTGRYALDSAEWSSYSNQNFGFCFDSFATGSHNLKIQAKDASGNESTITTINFSVTEN